MSSMPLSLTFDCSLLLSSQARHEATSSPNFCLSQTPHPHHQLIPMAALPFIDPLWSATFGQYPISFILLLPHLCLLELVDAGLAMISPSLIFLSYPLVSRLILDTINSRCSYYTHVYKLNKAPDRASNKSLARPSLISLFPVLNEKAELFNHTS